MWALVNFHMNLLVTLKVLISMSCLVKHKVKNYFFLNALGEMGP